MVEISRKIGGQGARTDDVMGRLPEDRDQVEAFIRVTNIFSLK